MAKNFNELRAKMSPERRARNEAATKKIIEDMSLQKLRAARDLTQESLANVLEVQQSEVSKIERRADMYVSTLASYVKAMGGNLEIRAVFADGDIVRISQFEELTEEPVPTRKTRSSG